MSRNLRSILGFSNRVKKSPAKARSSSTRSPRPTPTKRRAQDDSARENAEDKVLDDAEAAAAAAEEEEYYFQDRLDDVGLVRVLATDLHLRDVVQAMRYIRDRMWTAMPERGAGMNSTRIAEVLNYRARTPPVVTVAHLQAVLASPTAIEREVAELVLKGIVRRVVVKGRSEALIEVGDLVELVERAEGIGEESKRGYVAFVKGEGGGSLSREQIDELVRAGFLTSSPTRMHGVSTGGNSNSSGLLGTSMSLEHVAKAPTGTLGAVGGGAVHIVTGKGMPTSSSTTTITATPSSLQHGTASSAENLAISVPGHGAFLKLHKAALEHLILLLEKRSAFREMPEYSLREAWDGGLASAKGAKRARGEFSGVLPGRTKKWREYWGLRFEWVLEEAVGAGMVEIFETGSVGRGVRVV